MEQQEIDNFLTWGFRLAGAAFGGWKVLSKVRADKAKDTSAQMLAKLEDLDEKMARLADKLEDLDKTLNRIFDYLARKL